jgi:hypothetical protein
VIVTTSRTAMLPLVCAATRAMLRMRVCYGQRAATSYPGPSRAEHAREAGTIVRRLEAKIRLDTLPPCNKGFT